MPPYEQIRAQELKHIEESLKDDRKYKRRLARLHRESLDNIRREINADIERFAEREGVSMAKAKKMVSKTDVEAYQSRARRYVKEKDFSSQANREMRRYNVTMRTNRLELLQARVNLEIVSLASEEEVLLQEHLPTTMMKEYNRQAGILAMTAASQSHINRMYRSTMLSDVRGATFSDRIWQNQKELRNSVNTAIERTLIRGESPMTSTTQIMRSIRSDYTSKRYAAERIAVTETARAQSIAARESFEDAGIDKYIWIAEQDACEDCESLNGQVFELGKFGIGLNAVPKHPNCRCSIAAYVDDE